MKWQDRHKVEPAVYLLIRQDSKILMIRRFNTGYCDGMYSLPAGHLDGAETVKAAAIREACGEDFHRLTPGIRPAGAAIQDQARVMTPAQALKQGSTWLVVGRPITHAADPAAAAEAIVAEMEA